MTTTTKQTDEAIRIDETPVDELARQLFGFVDVKAEPTPLYYMDGETLRFRFHKYQKRAMRAKSRFLLLLGGTQSGKTSFGPIWLHREIKLRGAGDYLAIAPTYPLMQKKMLPEFLAFFEGLLNLGDYNKSDRIFTVSEDGEKILFGGAQKTKTKIYFGHAQDPDSLESATAKAAWLDECGQSKFKLASFEAILRRLSLFMGRVLMTTTPYNLGWLKQKFWDAWQAGKAMSLSVIRFPSIANPSFPRAEYERARRDLPRWKFDMFYRALFTRPAGMIYDCFTDDHIVEPFEIPADWPRYMGQDYGGVNTAAVYIAMEPKRNGRYFIYDEYLAGGRTAKQHVQAMTGAASFRFTVYGGAKSEQQWRDEFGAAGMPVNEPPVSDVEVGINRVYGAIQRGELLVFKSCEKLRDEFGSYARELDDMGQPTAKIADKNSYHLLDALRYIGSALWAKRSKLTTTTESTKSKWDTPGAASPRRGGSKWKVQEWEHGDN